MLASLLLLTYANFAAPFFELPENSGIAAIAATPFVLAASDKYRTRNMSFESIDKTQVYVPGHTYLLVTKNYGLSSGFHMRTSDLYLLYENTSMVFTEPIASKPEWTFLRELNRTKLIVPTTSVGNFEWICPYVPDGFYRLKYESGWAVYRDMSNFIAVSQKFQILSTFKNLSTKPPPQ